MVAAVADRITDEVLSLPVEDRLRLIEQLLTSLNLPLREDIDRAWAEEAERRVSQIEAGEAALIPGEEVFSRLRAKYQG
jgi:putative addiction module component (TIGR02574 family)